MLDRLLPSSGEMKMDRIRNEYLRGKTQRKRFRYKVRRGTLRRFGFVRNRGAEYITVY